MLQREGGKKCAFFIETVYQLQGAEYIELNIIITMARCDSPQRLAGRERERETYGRLRRFNEYARRSSALPLHYPVAAVVLV